MPEPETPPGMRLEETGCNLYRSHLLIICTPVPWYTRTTSFPGYRDDRVQTKVFGANFEGSYLNEFGSVDPLRLRVGIPSSITFKECVVVV